jgi:hypothetical protein
VNPVVTSACRYLNPFVLLRLQILVQIATHTYLSMAATRSSSVYLLLRLSYVQFEDKYLLTLQYLSFFFLNTRCIQAKNVTSFGLCSLSYHGRISDQLLECEILRYSIGKIPWYAFQFQKQERDYVSAHQRHHLQGVRYEPAELLTNVMKAKIKWDKMSKYSGGRLL